MSEKDPEHEPSLAQRVTPKLETHIGLVITLITGLVIMFRLLGMADWNQATAMAILHENGTSGILIGAFLSILPFIASTIIILIAVRTPYHLAKNGARPAARDLYYLLTLALIMIIIGPMIYLTLLLFGSLIAILTGLVDRSRPADTISRQNQRIYISTIGAPLVASLILGSTPWLPREVITTTDPASEKVVGFVLRSDGESFVLLKNQPRSIQYIRPDTIKTRALCGRQSWLETNLLGIVGGDIARYDDCP